MVDGLSADTDDIYNILSYNFAKVYAGNRSPLMFSVRAAWLEDARHIEALRQFIAYVRQFDDVFFVTIQQLIQWVKAPKIASQTGAMFPYNCPAAQYQVCLGPPIGGCAQGIFSWHTCRCVCTNNWCRDEKGTCNSAVADSTVTCPSHSDTADGSPDGQPDPDPIFNNTRPTKNNTRPDNFEENAGFRFASPFNFSSMSGVFTTALMGLFLLALAYGI
jgi:hypothetical protein